MKTLIKCVSEKESLSKRQQCELLELNRGTLYYKPTGEKQENLDIMRKMGLMAIYPKRNLSKLGLVKYIRPNIAVGKKEKVLITRITRSSYFRLLTFGLHHHIYF